MSYTNGFLKIANIQDWFGWKIKLIWKNSRNQKIFRSIMNCQDDLIVLKQYPETSVTKFLLNKVNLTLPKLGKAQHQLVQFICCLAKSKLFMFMHYAGWCIMSRHSLPLLINWFSIIVRLIVVVSCGHSQIKISSYALSLFNIHLSNS